MLVNSQLVASRQLDFFLFRYHVFVLFFGKYFEESACELVCDWTKVHLNYEQSI